MSTFSFIRETEAELLKAFRAPEFILPTIILPVAFYALFALAITATRPYATHMFATFGVFAVMGPSIFGFGVGVASERDRGWLRIKRASPAPALSFIGAKLVVTLAVCMLALTPVYLLAAIFGDIALAPSQWAMVSAVHLLAVPAFVLVGLILGFSLSANGAVAVSNIVFITFSTLGGLWMPIAVFPEFLKTFAFILPSYHFGELALSAAGVDGDRAPMVNILAVAVMTTLFAIAASAAWFRQR